MAPIWWQKYFLSAGLPAHQCWCATTYITTGGTYITTYHHIYHHRWHICGCGNDDEYSSVGPSDVSRRVPNPVMGREMLEALLLNKSSQCHIVSYCTTTSSPQQELTMREPHMAIMCHIVLLLLLLLNKSSQCEPHILCHIALLLLLLLLNKTSHGHIVSMMLGGQEIINNREISAKYSRSSLQMRAIFHQGRRFIEGSFSKTKGFWLRGCSYIT